METLTKNNIDIIVYAASFFVGFIFGVVVGWIIHRYLSKKVIENWERAIISIIVLMVWSVSVVLDIVIPSYGTPAPVHAIMGLVAGYFFEGSITDFFTRGKNN